MGWGVLTLGFMCKHGTLPVCHVQTCHATGVSCVIVDRVLIAIGFNVFLLCLTRPYILGKHLSHFPNPHARTRSTNLMDPRVISNTN